VFIDKTPESNYFPYLLPLFPLLYLDSPASSHTSVTSFGYLVPTVWPRPEALPEPETSLDRWAGGERYKKNLGGGMDIGYRAQEGAERESQSHPPPIPCNQIFSFLPFIRLFHFQMHACRVL
jgi:hypothetical protein